MTNNIEIVNAAVTLIIKAALLASRFSGRARKRNLKKLSKMDVDEKDKEIIFLRDKVDQQQMQITILQKGLQKKQTDKRYTLLEKLFIFSYMEIFQVPRRRVTEHLGIAKSTLYRRLHKIEEQQQSSIPVNKTPLEIASLVWEITKANVSWGRVRIANQLALLNIFISGSTVQNILNQPKLTSGPKTVSKPKKAA
jgi:hypothetical protein